MTSGHLKMKKGTPPVLILAAWCYTAESAIVLSGAHNEWKMLQSDQKLGRELLQQKIFYLHHGTVRTNFITNQNHM